ncbi:hypothetical protein D0C36_24035 [Mucilaginibacter conchicola]|uniref:Uncharacterized protein n=1 Tax=Mucilaginibacter conchicola TaxID=2303333 RepID=A0A372NLT0_9SPHI|nr:hypothetical protein [Mucilaginibacter conchicola]RFZ89916.1 hypothetical protein D0C36_24035 [Mucilaginibacter conchicola]
MAIADSFSTFILKRYLCLEDDYLVKFGQNVQKGSLMAKIPVLPFWQQLTFGQKLLAILKRSWKPTDAEFEKAAQETFLREVFGKEEDFGMVLYDINLLHHYRQWDFDSLTEGDLEKFEGLQSLRVLLSVKNWTVTSDYLHLSLWEILPDMCVNLIPISFYIPVTSIRYCLELQENFTFNSIRKASHPLADDIISYLYEVLGIQQKIANGFYNLMILMDKVRREKADVSFMTHEIDCLTIIDSTINYLKATIEKGVLLLALTCEIKNLDGYKTHRQKLSALERNVPLKVKNQPYYQFIWNQIQSDELLELNNLRSGINHKKGISKVQPHSFVNKSFEETALWELFMLLKRQHQINTLTLIGTLAILADDLISRRPPTEEDEIYLNKLIAVGKPAYEKLFEKYVENGGF